LKQFKSVHLKLKTVRDPCSDDEDIVILPLFSDRTGAELHAILDELNLLYFRCIAAGQERIQGTKGIISHRRPYSVLTFFRIFWMFMYETAGTSE